jgi:hypothetical protein
MHQCFANYKCGLLIALLGFSCKLKSKKSIRHGYLYITPKFVCFCGRMFGYVKKVSGNFAVMFVFDYKESNRLNR